MNRKAVNYCVVCILAIGFSGCSTDSIPSIEKEISASKNNGVSLVNQTTLKTKESGYITINEFCINESLVVFIDGYQSGGAVNMGDSEKCK